ncbi:transposase [Candidatus Sumerlaeota bacterium]|nr:transposase [Candidatus Sumerlaeota bacterium]
MARPKRIDLPYSIFHAFSRTLSGETLFHDARDRAKFLYYLAKFTNIYDFRVHAWCLMPTHFHLLLESPKTKGLSHLMHRLLTAYTVYYNKRHQRQGHLFQGRFKSLIVEKTDYFLAVSRYIHLNPASVSRNTNPENYEGSSLRFYVKGGEPDYLYTSETLRWFQGERKKYAKFVREGLEGEIKLEIIQQRYIGSESFARRIRKRKDLYEKKSGRAKNTKGGTENDGRSDLNVKAEQIITLIAEHFNISRNLLMNRIHSRSEAGRARKALAYLLHEHLPWTIGEITTFMGLKQQVGVHAQIKKVREDKSLKNICFRISKKINIY